MRFRLRTLLIVLAALVAAPSLVGQDKSDPGQALYGEWEIVEMIFRRTPQDFGGMPGGWFFFDKGGFIQTTSAQDRDSIQRSKVHRRAATEPCVVKPGEIDITTKPIGGRQDKMLKALYELKNDTLRVIWDNEYGERPTGFDDAVKDPRLTLFVLKKVK